MKSVKVENWVFLVCLGVFFTSLQASAEKAAEQAITVSGSGSVDAVPDRLSFSIYIEERGEVVSKLYTKVNQKTQLLLAALKQEQVSDVQSMSIQVLPWIEYQNQTRVQRGFELQRNIQVTLNDTELLGTLLDRLFRVGNVQISQFSLQVSDYQHHYQKALQTALRNAKQKAQMMAKTLGLKAGEALSIVEFSAQQHPIQEMSFKSSAPADAFAPGNLAISAAVEVVFALE